MLHQETDHSIEPWMRLFDAPHEEQESIDEGNTKLGVGPPEDEHLKDAFETHEKPGTSDSNLGQEAIWGMKKTRGGAGRLYSSPIVNSWTYSGGDRPRQPHQHNPHTQPGHDTSTRQARAPAFHSQTAAPECLKSPQ